MPRTLDVREFLDRPQLGPLRVRIVAVCWFIAVLDGFDVQAMAFVAPVLSRLWAIPRESMGQILTAGIAGILVGSFALGRLSDRVGRRPVLIGSVLGFAACSLATAFCTGTSSLLLLRFLTGIGLGGVTIAALTLTAEYAPSCSRASIVTVMYVGFPIGGILGGVLATPLIDAFGWQGIFAVGGIVPALTILCVWRLLPESLLFSSIARAEPREIGMLLERIAPDYTYRTDDSFSFEGRVASAGRGGSAQAGLLAVFAEGRLRGTLLLSLICFANLLVLYLLVSWLPSILGESGMTASAANLGAAVFNAGGVVGALCLSRIVDRRSTLVLAMSYLLAAVSIGMLAWPLVAEVGIVVTLLAGVGVIGSQFCINAVAAAYYPTEIRATGVGWVLGVGRVGSVVGPLAAGVALGAGATPHALLSWLCIPMAVCAVASWSLFLEQRRSAAVAAANGVR